jgi:hypothetical protein
MYPLVLPFFIHKSETEAALHPRITRDLNLSLLTMARRKMLTVHGRLVGWLCNVQHIYEVATAISDPSA